MKKFKILSLVAIALVAVMLLSSCGAGSVGIKKLLDPDAETTDNTTVLNGSYLIDDLTGAEFEEQVGDIAYFTVDSDVGGAGVFTKHVLYNVEYGSFIYASTELKTKDVTIDVNETANGVGYFTVTTHTWQLDEKDVKKVGSDNYITELFTGNGIELAETNRDEEAYCLYDIVYFNGACYRTDDNGGLSYAFDYSPLAAIPEIDSKYYDRYYEVNEYLLSVYDENLALVSTYYFPTYIENRTYTVLENGNVWLQYSYLADQYSDEFDVMDESGEKYIIETKIIDVKKGTEKDVDTDYLVSHVYNVEMLFDIFGRDTVTGMKYDEYPIVGMAFAIENRRMPAREYGREYRYITISKDGKVKEFEPFNGENVAGISFVAQNRWVVSTMNHRYLIDADCEIIGDISNAREMAGFLVCDGKVYDYDLNEMFDYGSRKYTLHDATESAIIFKNTEGDYILYTGGSNTSVIVDHIETTSLLTPPYRIQNMGAVNERYYVVNETYVKATGADYKYKVYNESGMSIGEFEFTVGKVCETDSAVILSGTNKSGKTVFYRFS